MTDTRERARELSEKLRYEALGRLPTSRVRQVLHEAADFIEQSRTPPSISEDDVERAARSIHQARFKKPGHEFEPWEMDESDHEYATRLARAAIAALRSAASKEINDGNESQPREI